MRKLAFFTLGIYISIIFSSFGLASSSVAISKPCFGSLLADGSGMDTTTATNIYNGTAKKEDLELSATYYRAYQSTYDLQTCGEINTTTNSYEMGDCANASTPQVVTEILEPVGPATSVGNDKIIDLYKGVCCISGAATTKSDGSEGPFYCDQTRNVYFDTYENCTNGAESCSRVQWLIASTGAGILKTYVKQIYIFGAGMVGFIAVATIVASGIQISVSGASGDITAAKDRITQSIMGIALLFLSALILYTINPTFFY